MAEAHDAAQLRSYLLTHYSTDYGASDDLLLSYAKQAQATVAELRDGTGWLWQAGKDMRRAYLLPEADDRRHP